MGLSRNKVAVPEGAAGTPPFWRILKGVPDAARRKPSKSRNTSFLERATKRFEKRFVSNPCFFTTDVYYIEKDEAERSNGEA